MTAPVTPTTTVPPKPSVWTNPNFWVTQVGAVVAFIIALAGIFKWNASYSGLLAEITVPVAFVIALAFEIAWVIHHDGISRLGLDTFLNWLRANFTSLQAVVTLAKHVPVLTALVEALDNAGVKDVEQFVSSLVQHLVTHNVTGATEVTGTAVLSAPLHPAQPPVQININTGSPAAPAVSGAVATGPQVTQGSETQPEAPDISGNPPGGGTAHAGIDPMAPPPPPTPPAGAGG